MRVFFDDERDLPQGYDYRISTYGEMLLFWDTNYQKITEISFDYYLAGSPHTGEDVLKYILHFCESKQHDHPRFRFHSSDRAARFRMKTLVRTSRKV